MKILINYRYQSLVHEQSREVNYHKLGVSHTRFAGCLVFLMIDISIYRCRIGIYAGGRGLEKGGNSRNENYDFSVFSPNCPRSTKFYLFEQSTKQFEENVVHGGKYFTNTKLFMLFYFYIMLLFTMITQSIVCSPNFKINYNIYSGVVYLKWDLSFITVSYIKIACFYLMFYVLLRTVCSRKKWAKNLIFNFIKCTRYERILTCRVHFVNVKITFFAHFFLLQTVLKSTLNIKQKYAIFI